MTMSRCKTVFFLILALAWQVSNGVLRAEDAAGKASEKQRNKILITADALVSDSDGKWAEFIGNVRASQGNAVIMSDRLKVFQKSGARKTGAVEGGVGGIERIEAEGKVKITFDNKTALAGKALYKIEDGKRVVTLEGKDSTIISGDSRISGSRIIMHLDEGRIKVEGGADAPVEGVFYPDDTME